MRYVFRSSLVECKYFLVGTIVRIGVRVDVGVELHVESFTHSALRRRTVSFNVDSKHFFYRDALFVTYKFIHC